MIVAIDTNRLVQYEAGELNADEQVDFFASLIAENADLSLQGAYGRMAHAYIVNGYIDTKGNVLRYPEEEF